MSQLLEFVEKKNGPCPNCRFGKDHYAVPPQECAECAFLAERDKPICRIPIFKEDFQPHNVEDNLKALREIVKQNIPCDKKGCITEMFFDWPVGTPKKEILKYYDNKLAQLAK